MSDVQQLLTIIETELPRDEWAVWPGGRASAIEAALIDAVFSIQANYGSEHNGARGGGEIGTSPRWAPTLLRPTSNGSWHSTRKCFRSCSTTR